MKSPVCSVAEELVWHFIFLTRLPVLFHSDETYLCLSTGRYVFPGAEIFYDPDDVQSDSDDCMSSSSSSTSSSSSSDDEDSSGIDGDDASTSRNAIPTSIETNNPDETADRGTKRKIIESDWPKFPFGTCHHK